MGNLYGCRREGSRKKAGCTFRRRSFSFKLQSHIFVLLSNKALFQVCVCARTRAYMCMCVWMLSARCGGCQCPCCRIINLRRSLELPGNCHLICIIVQISKISNELSFFTGSLVAPELPLIYSSVFVCARLLVYVCQCFLCREVPRKAGITTTVLFFSHHLVLFLSPDDGQDVQQKVH